MPRSAVPRARKSAAAPAAAKRVSVPHHVRRRLSEDAVLESAERLFVRRGFHDTTVDDIAKAASLTKGAVYFHFRDKSDVLMALLRRAEDRVLYPILNRLRNSTGSASSKIVEYLHSWARIALEQRDTMFLPILMSFEFLGTGDPVELQIAGMYDRIYACLAEVIKQGRAAGELKDDGPIEADTAVLVAITDGMLLEWLRHSEKFDGVQVTRALRGLVLGGLLATDQVAAASAALEAQAHAAKGAVRGAAGSPVGGAVGDAPAAGGEGRRRSRKVAV